MGGIYHTVKEKGLLYYFYFLIVTGYGCTGLTSRSVIVFVLGMMYFDLDDLKKSFCKKLNLLENMFVCGSLRYFAKPFVTPISFSNLIINNSKTTFLRVILNMASGR